MRPKLKEDVREWRKFLLVMVTAGLLLAAWMAYRRRLSAVPFGTVLGLLALVLGAGLSQPRWIRPVYRLVMTASFYVGQVVGRILLALVFLLVVTPLALIRRLMGYDGLRLRRRGQDQSYWREATPPGPLDREF